MKRLVFLVTVFSLWSGPVAVAVDDARPGLTSKALAARTTPRGQTLFQMLSPQATGLVTENKYADPRMWGERYHEFEVGSVGTGVAIGDYDGDGRPDVFVVSKTESCRLFRNLGDWKFADVTETAGVVDRGDAAMIWKQGATFVDVNNDGRLDLYVCRFAAPNLLYVNQGDGTFKEQAAARGLAVVDASAMGAFCDYDRDGWLDVFVLTNMLDAAGHPNGQRPYLFHNDGDGTFTNVTDRAGIRCEGQGHSATWWDYDDDGWPDLYGAYDFAGPDVLYRNNRDGTFTNIIDQVVPHTTLSSMGSDLGDVNNDGLIDLLVADMAATTHQKDQRTMAQMRSLALDPPDGSSIAPQYPHSALFLATGTGRCLEAARLAGIDATDWTWSPRFEDLDEDGRLDLMVTNGMHRESHNVDLMSRMMLAESTQQKIQAEKNSPVLAEANLAFRNLGDLQFENVSAVWGLDERGVSFGSAFGDLDGDGDLDVVYGNYQKGATVLRNDNGTGHHVLFDLRGTRSNRFGVGATVRLATAAGAQIRQLVLARGVLSSSEPVVHFGLGEATQIARVEVTWPSGTVQTFENLAADRRYTITEPDQVTETGRPVAAESAPLFTDISVAANLSWASPEAKVDELDQQPLLPARQNRRGPWLAAGDLNRDGRDDVVIGGTGGAAPRVLLGDKSGRFAPADGAVPGRMGALNDGPVVLLDADGDGTLDLLVTKSGVAGLAGASDYQPALYLNDGRARFRAAAAGALPDWPASVGEAVAADFDRDGRPDVFVGGRVVPGQYAQTPGSALWANRGGRFEDVTEAVAPGLREVGRVTAALWSDLDGDGWPDLLVAVEWGPVRCFHNEGGKAFADWTERLGLAAAGTGWWSALATADFNGDGRPDLVAGNLGLNTPYRADETHPIVLYAGDFKGDGGEQLIEGFYEGDRLLPRRARRDLGASIPSVLKRFPKNDAYARATLGEILGEAKLAEAQRFAATQLQSGVFLSQPDGSYRFAPLPRIAQIAPIEGLVAGDFDGDGHPDIYAVQNSYAPVPSLGRFDGGLSQLLRGDGRGRFTAVSAAESGLIVPGDAKHVAVVDLDGDGRPDLVVTRNNSTTLAYRNHGSADRAAAGFPGQADFTTPAKIEGKGAPENPSGNRTAPDRPR